MPTEAAAKPVYEPGQYWNERLEKEFSLAGVGHTSVGLAFNRWAYKVRRQDLKRTLSHHHIDVNGENILELGFGTGFYLDLWAELGAAHISGFDIADVAVQSARERFAAQNWRLEAGDIGAPLDLGDAEGKCALATAFDVLFHLVEDAHWNAALDNLTKSLRPSGYLIVFDKFQRVESGVSHVKRRTLARYREALSERGMEVLSVKPLFFFMNSPTDFKGLSKLFFKTQWSLVKTPYKLGRKIGLGEPLGWTMGVLTYLPERFMTWALPTGPSTKILVARKR